MTKGLKLAAAFVLLASALFLLPAPLHAQTAPIDTFSGLLLRTYDKNEKKWVTIKVTRELFALNGVNTLTKLMTVNGVFLFPNGIPGGEARLGINVEVSDEKSPDKPSDNLDRAQFLVGDLEVKPSNDLYGPLYDIDLSHPCAGFPAVVIRVFYKDRDHHYFDVPLLSWLIPALGHISAGTTTTNQVSSQIDLFDGAVCSLSMDMLNDAAAKLRLDPSMVNDYGLLYWENHIAGSAVSGQYGNSVGGGVLPSRFDPMGPDYIRFCAFMDSEYAALHHLSGSEAPAPYEPRRYANVGVYKKPVETAHAAEPTAPITPPTPVAPPVPTPAPAPKEASLYTVTAENDGNGQTWEVFTYGEGHRGHVLLTADLGEGPQTFWLGTDAGAKEMWRIPTYRVHGSRNIANLTWHVIIEGTFKGTPFTDSYDAGHTRN